MGHFKLLNCIMLKQNHLGPMLLRWVLESTNSNKAVQTAVKVSCTKTLEIEEKDRSIIMFNHPEYQKKNYVEGKKDDIEFVHRFINQGLQISEQPVHSCFRLG